MTPEEIALAENIVNEKIKGNLKVAKDTIDYKDAVKQGALTVPGAQYPEKVTVYKINNYSKEVCGGPHVDFTGGMGTFKIIKEEASGNTNRRIYAALS